MADYRLKIKIGEHEFEAEGPVDAVKAQFDSFRELISSIPERKSENAPTMQSPEAVLQPPAKTTLDVDRIFRAENRIISLTIRPESETDAVLLILYGQRHYRNNETPTGSEIMDGMDQSGYRMTRIDRILANLFADGTVNITGAHRGKRYRLTNQGVTRAEGVIREALAKLP
jgi:hypothetical protein